MSRASHASHEPCLGVGSGRSPPSRIFGWYWFLKSMDIWEVISQLVLVNGSFVVKLLLKHNYKITLIIFKDFTLVARMRRTPKEKYDEFRYLTFKFKIYCELWGHVGYWWVDALVWITHHYYTFGWNSHSSDERALWCDCRRVHEWKRRLIHKW